MTIPSTPNVKFIPDSHRCYEYILDFVVASAALGQYLNAYHNQPVGMFSPHLSGNCHQYPTLSFAGQASGKHVDFIPHDIFTNIFVNGTRKGTIPYLSISTYQNTVGNSTGAMAETFEGFAQAMFTRYYENNLTAIETKYGKRKANKWPPVLQFAVVVRDAMSHGGTIHMRPQVPPVTYFGLSFSNADNGRKILHNDMTCADIFYLMLEMDLAF